jgi:hypothetical protein
VPGFARDLGDEQDDARLLRAKARLDRLAWYPSPVRTDRVRVVVAPWFFRLPYLRRFDGYTWPRLILVRSRDASDDLLTHELCHVWQLQHKPVALVLSYALAGYWNNPFEVQARRAVALTRAPAEPSSAGTLRPRPGG